MKRLHLVLLAWAISGSAQAQTAVPARIQNPLAPQQRARLEELACGPLGVAAIEITGARALGSAGKSTSAHVKCAPHVRSPDLQAGKRFHCDRNGTSWSCQEDDVYLRRTVAGQGPFEIPARYLTVDQAQTVIGCFEAALQAQPALLESGPLTKVEFLLRTAPSDQVVIGLKSASRCFTARLNLQCASEAGRATPMTVASCD
jgi:hypothetical protein